jgi:hypothetical protein
MMGGRIGGGGVGKLIVIHCASKSAVHRVFEVLKLSGYYMYHKAELKKSLQFVYTVSLFSCSVWILK